MPEGQTTCVLSSSSPGVFSISVPGAVTKNPTTNLTFTSLRESVTLQTVTFTSNTPSGASGYSIAASRISGPVTSTGQAGFTLVVNSAPTPSDTTKPVLNLPNNITEEATGSATEPQSPTVQTPLTTSTARSQRTACRPRHLPAWYHYSQLLRHRCCRQH